jgi:hypothetical protein
MANEDDTPGNGTQPPEEHTSEEIGKASEETKRQETAEEELAREEVKRYNRHAGNPRVIKTIPNYANGTLCLVEFDDLSGKEEIWYVVVRGNRAIVFYDAEHALNEGARQRWFVDFAAPGVVVAALTFIVVAACIAAFFNSAAPHTVAEPFNAALTVVLGFWFGKFAR